MFKTNIILLFAAIAFIHSAYSKSIPSYIKQCKRNDPDLNKCLKEMVIQVKPYLLKGIPELKIPSYDPFVVPKVTVDQGSSEAVKFKATFKDMITHGLNSVEIKDVKINLKGDEPTLDLHLFFPTVTMTSDYTVDGKILVVPIKGTGKSNATLTDVTAKVKFIGKFITKKGKTYVTLPSKKVQIDMKNARFYFSNLFNGNKELGESTNLFINENWREILKEVKPVVEETVVNIVETLIKHLFTEFSYDELLPEK